MFALSQHVSKIIRSKANGTYLVVTHFSHNNLKIPGTCINVKMPKSNIYIGSSDFLDAISTYKYI